MICLFNKYKKSVQKRTDFFDNSFFNAVPDKPLATRNKPHNNQLCADLSRFISAYPVVSHFLRFAWQTTPCQDFSSAGHRDENLGRAVLTYTYRDIILRIKPKYFVMENVPEITKSAILKEIKDSFKEVGYGLTEHVLDASYCGVPQSRKRFFLVGSLNDEDDFLQEELDRNLADAPMSMRDYFGDSLGIDYYFRVPRSYSRRGVFSIDEPCQTIRGVDRPIPPGYPGHPSDPVEIGSQVRALTIEERSYVQTFPRDFVFQGNKTDLNQMIGNAVPVKLAEYVATALRTYDRKPKRRKENAND
jgi:DNA (cytosine-5)-methyltransferase 1